MLPTPPAHPPPTGMNVRQKERVLLGLDEAFGVGRRRFDGGAPGSGSGSNLDAVLYQKLPCEVLLQEQQQASEGSMKTVEGAIGDLFLKRRGPTAEERLRGKTVMLENTKSQTEQQCQERRIRRQLLRKKRRLSVSIPEEESDKKTREGRGSYADYLSLHHAWVRYISDVLGIQRNDGGVTASAGSSSLAGDEGDRVRQEPISQKRVLTADLHGCKLKVSESKCNTDVGLAGIVIRESKTAFHVMTMKDKVKIVPKAGRRFQIDLSPYFITLHGNGLLDRQRAITSPLFRSGSKGKGGQETDRFLVNTKL